MRHFHFQTLGSILLTTLLLIGCAQRAQAGTDLDIFINGLNPAWEDWSWDSTRNFADAAQTHSGSASIAVTPAAWGTLSLRTATPPTGADHTALAFWGYGAAGGTELSVYVQTGDEGAPLAGQIVTLPANTWQEVLIPLADLGNPGQLARINFQSNRPTAQPTFYLDDIRLIGQAGNPPAATLQLTVDVGAERKPISPDIYGINDYGITGDPVALMEELGISVRRWGGNTTSRYNWQTDVANHASDWYFNNNRQSNAVNLPDDSAVNRLIDQNNRAGAASLLVMPLSGYVSNADGNTCSFRISVYGPQTANAGADGRPNCGSGIAPGGAFITGNNPLDTSIAITESFVTDWVTYLVGRYGRADAGGIRFYNLDNEPDLWFETHRDVRPIGLTYDQLRDLGIRYGLAIKQADPSAQVLGPTLMGWTYYWHSPNDGQKELWETRPDRMAHGDLPLVPWYLDQMRQAETAQSKRILDYLDLHYYPQANGVALSEAGDAATQARRLRSTRALWDPTYVDESWIKDAGPDGGIVRLIPRMHAWVADHYPGTKLAIGEYNWGALDHINGALAQADVLGIFGREGIDLATLWEPPKGTDPGAFAFRIYRNYDGAGSRFGDTHVAAASSDQGRLSIYAAQRGGDPGDKALTLVVINKSGDPLDARLSLAGFTTGGPGQVYRYSAANLGAIVADGDVDFAAGAAQHTFPANSITLIVVPQAATPPNPNPNPNPPGQARLHLPALLR
jgi:hypothetical protein